MSAYDYAYANEHPASHYAARFEPRPNPEDPSCWAWHMGLPHTDYTERPHVLPPHVFAAAREYVCPAQHDRNRPTGTRYGTDLLVFRSRREALAAVYGPVAAYCSC